jgi:exo-1,4-beta-D-glucosaminidase
MFANRALTTIALLNFAALAAGACQSKRSTDNGSTAMSNPSAGFGAGTLANAGNAGACTGNCPAANGGSAQGGANGVIPDASASGDADAGCVSCNAGRTLLANGWTIQASSKVTGSTGAQISVPGFATAGWYPITVPSTVFAGLVANQVYPDPYIGDNMSQVPDAIADSSWWYRTEFTADADFAGQAVFLALDGVNYKANVWLNGQQIASSDTTVGTFTNYEWNVSAALHVGMPNALAVEVIPPNLDTDLALTWLDWNPGPPDRDMGIWHDVYLRKSGPVAVRGTHVTSKVDPSLASAALTIKADLLNTTNAAVHATVTATLEQITVSQTVDLAAGERKTISFDPSTTKELSLNAPRLWWPAQMGSQELYQLSLTAQASGATSDSETIQFGIRDVSSSLTPEGYRLFSINGKRILIRGGGWASDMMLRLPAERLDSQFQYVRALGLNAIRLEGKMEFDEFFDAADRYGILVIPGWMCCDHWQDWSNWSAADHEIAVASVTTQAERMRNHPSVIDFLIGSDEAPPAAVESEFLAAFSAADWPNPLGASAADRSTPTLGKSGMKMPGPYDWVAPSYWMLDTQNGGAFGFNSETGPGAAIPELETLQVVLSAQQQTSLWTDLDGDQYHAGTIGPQFQFSKLSIFNTALSMRHGAPTSLADYVRKAQLMNYEAERAPYEAYSRNQYASATGIIHWMLNNAWPSLIWHLYGTDLAPAGSYFGAKKGNEPLHILYSYDSRAVVVVNHTQSPETALSAAVRVYNLDASLKYSNDASITVGADSTAPVVTVPALTGLSGTYFVELSLSRGSTLVSSNFYWLSSTAEKIDFANSDWFHSPTSTYADYSALSTLGAATLQATWSSSQSGATGTGQVTLTNSGSTVAFFTRLKLTAGKGGKMVLPVLWQDNYVSLMPNETRTVTVSYALSDLAAATPAVEVSGWNVASQVLGG